MTAEHIYPISDTLVSRHEQQLLLNQQGMVLWFTGLSGSGKSTIVQMLQRSLYQKGYHVVVLDGDNIRSGINTDLTFSNSDRIENIRRVAEVAKILVSAGSIVLCSFVSPTRTIRKLAAEIIGSGDFSEVYVDTPLEVCEERDVKGLYRKARAGIIKDFTGVSSPYESPTKPHLVLTTTKASAAELADKCIRYLESKT